MLKKYFSYEDKEAVVHLDEKLKSERKQAGERVSN